MASTATDPTAMATSEAVIQDGQSLSQSAMQSNQLTQVATTSSGKSSYSSARTESRRPSLTRRTSLEEDYFYREVMTVEKRPTEPPPSYESTMKKIRRMERQEAAEAAAAAAAAAAIAAAAAPTSSLLPPSYKGKGKASTRSDTTRKRTTAAVVASGAAQSSTFGDILPAYSCDIHIEGVFQRKMEIENTTKRAEDRRWITSYVVLHGTSLEVYDCRKDRSRAGRTARTGPDVSPDRPPWMRKAGMVKRYNISYADAGIAADYEKRRYVIRIRAEADQFLLACVELETFIQWLDALFAALSVAAPIDERDFPRDQSIPRLQRVRWFQGRDRDTEDTSERAHGEEQHQENERQSNRDSDPENNLESSSRVDVETSDQIKPLLLPSSSPLNLPPVSSSNCVNIGQSPAATAAAVLAEDALAVSTSRAVSLSSSESVTSVEPASPAFITGGSNTAPLYNVSVQQRAAAMAMMSPGDAASSSVSVNNANNIGGRSFFRSLQSRLKPRGDRASGSINNGARSILNMPPIDQNAIMDVTTDKWQPSHRWTKTHDMVYAKLCYSTLLFRSPRKSNYIIMRGKQWLVDWTTGNMLRVNPPRYGETEILTGPFQILRTENIRI
ncbi:hypothetical protein SEPCBS57363_002500 [Sporothrix epigloea]|uniref:PH domain-containing protein n=1 Tax=Sporothrix epigloea TaxID=1892477 RepID=A0ABP0DKB7_9PEZI